MSRLGFIARHPKRALSALATLLVASGLVVGSGAFFQSTDTNDNSSVSAGTIALEAYGGEANSGSNGRQFDARDCSPREASQPGPSGNFDGCYNSVNNGNDPFTSVRNGAIMEITNIEPGQIIEKQSRLKNNGSIDANTYLRLINHTGNNDLFNALQVRVDNVSKSFAPVYQGSLSGLADAWNDADGTGVLTHGTSDVYRFQIKLPETGTDQSLLMGKSTAFQVQWLGRDQGAPAPTP
jgi:hypothetical protein